MRLDGKVVVVTGASSGIGRAIAIGCAREGADLAITYRGNQAGAEDTAGAIRELGRRAEVLRVDISRDEDVEALATEVRQRFGRVDAWINNAGADILTGAGGRLSARREARPRAGRRPARDDPRVLGGGGADAGAGRRVIINMSWDHVGFGMAGENPILYSAAKGGIMSFSKSFAREVAPRHPGEHPGAGLHRDRVRRAGRRALAAGRGERERRSARWGTPEDVAGAAVFLASDESEFLTGQMIMVNGGVVM